MCATSVAKLARLGRCGDLAPPRLAGPFKAGEVGAGGGGSAMLVSGRAAALEEEEEEEEENEDGTKRNSSEGERI